MFDKLTDELLDLTAMVRGEGGEHFAAVIDCCSCCSCSCLWFCW
jgi:hypothetical protein